MNRISNRDKILMELLREPLTFSTLKQKVGVSGKTLTKHLKSLKDEGLLKREIQGKYIVYVVVEPRTLLEMRKDFWNKLLALHITYRGCLTKETSVLFSKVFEALGKSIRDPELKAQSTKSMVRLIKIPEGLEKGMGIEIPENIFEKVKIVRPEKPKTRGRRRVYG